MAPSASWWRSPAPSPRRIGLTATKTPWAGAQFDPLAVVALGLGLLLLTPVAGVLVALVGFLSVGDQLYAGIAALVLVILVVSLVTGGGHP